MHGGAMAGEIGQAADVVRVQGESLRAPIAELASRLRRVPPAFAVTCARGSSGHAAAFAKHLIERRFGISVAAAAPNIATVYRRDLNLDGVLFVAISQSGASDDLVEEALSAKRGGALTVALVNEVASPLAAACDVVLPLSAGREMAVAATKSFIASLTAILRLVAAWAEDAALDAALGRLPERIALSAACDWRLAEGLRDATSAMVLGRGPTLAIAREAALKLKEVCDTHAEAFSGAEFRHGPIALVTRGYPVLMFLPGDEARREMLALRGGLAAMGAALFVAGCGSHGNLPSLAPDHPEADVVPMIASFYRFAIALAHLRGIDPDRPRHLNKVTRTR